MRVALRKLGRHFEANLPKLAFDRRSLLEVLRLLCDSPEEGLLKANARTVEFALHKLGCVLDSLAPNSHQGVVDFFREQSLALDFTLDFTRTFDFTRAFDLAFDFTRAFDLALDFTLAYALDRDLEFDLDHALDDHAFDRDLDLFSFGKCKRCHENQKRNYFLHTYLPKK